MVCMYLKIKNDENILAKLLSKLLIYRNFNFKFSKYFYITWFNYNYDTGKSFNKY